MRVFDLAAAANVVDIGRHRPKLILATRPLGHSATRPRRHVAFLDKPHFLWFECLSGAFIIPLQGKRVREVANLSQ